MTVAWLLLAGSSALALYLASDQQRLGRVPLASPRRVRRFGWALLLGSALLAAAQLGPVPGVFAALTAWMLALVVLPLLGAARDEAA